MPEGPTIRRTANLLNNNFKNQELLEINFSNKEPKDLEKLKNVLPTKFTANAKGKFLWLEFDNTEITFWNTFGLSGEYSFKPDKYVKFELVFKNKKIYYNDKLNYGSQKIGLTKDELYIKINSLGYDILDSKIQDDNFLELLRKKSKRSTKNIGAMMMDQKIAAGCGNYIRADSLYLAKIDPFKKISELSDTEIKCLWNCLQKVAFYNYNFKVGVDEGIYNNEDIEIIKKSKIYKRKKDLYNNPIITNKIDNRTIHYCPSIQI